MKIKKRLGLIGVGNMGTAILEGLMAKQILSPSQITVYDKMSDKAKAFARKFKVRLASSNPDLVRHSDVIVFAVKPQDLAVTAADIVGLLNSSHLVLSILAGTPIAKLKKFLGRKAQIIRAMPNLGARVGQSMTALTGAGPGAKKIAEAVFSGCGQTVVLPERQFDLVTAVSGSGPAYFFYLMELLAHSAVELGMSEKQASMLAVQTAVGAGLLAQQSGESPELLRKKVTSKRGTTEAALKVMMRSHMKQMIQRAVKAARERGRELSRM